MTQLMIKQGFIVGCLLVWVLVGSGVSYAQDKSVQEVNDPTLDIGKEVERIAGRKRRARKSLYKGYRCRRRVLRRRIQGHRRVLEIFRVLPKRAAFAYVPYVPYLYWYDKHTGKIKQGAKARFDPKRHLLLHGPYIQKVDTLTTAKRFFYLGTRDGRWANWTLTYKLVNKAHYNKGWRRDAHITYYDPERKRLREVIPMEFGNREGMYYAFHRTGNLACRGSYERGCRIGTWIEFYVNGQPKREIKYTRTPCDGETRPYISREWNNQRKLIYQNTRAQP